MAVLPEARMREVERAGGSMNNVWLICFATLLSCSVAEQSDSASNDKVLRAWNPLTAGPTAVRRAMGEDCSATGKRGCVDGVCLHLEGHATRGYFCSSTCSHDDDCPDAWQCRPMVSGDNVRYCVAPRGWAARAVSARGKSTGLRISPTPTALPPLQTDGGTP